MSHVIPPVMDFKGCPPIFIFRDMFISSVLPSLLSPKCLSFLRSVKDYGYIFTIVGIWFKPLVVFSLGPKIVLGFT